MNRNPAAHAAHDELLLARLFGGDLEGPERERARELAASCGQCAAILADYKAIAAATVALPIPPRPRDFRLSEAQAAALRRRRLGRLAGVRAVFGSLGPVRSLGASMAAVGVAGVLALGVFSTLDHSNAGFFGLNRAGQPAEAGGAYSSAAAGQDKNGENAAPSAAGPIAVLGSPGPEASQSTRAGYDRSPAAVESPGSESTAGSQTDDGTGFGETPPPSPQRGSDAPLVWLLGFTGLVVAGLTMLAVPTLWRRLSAGRQR